MASIFKTYITYSYNNKNFKVVIDETTKSANIYINDVITDNDIFASTYSKLVLTIPNYQYVWIGSGIDGIEFPTAVQLAETVGNSLLFKITDNEYYHISDTIIKFNTIEEITQFIGHIDDEDNEVYGLGISFNYVYLLNNGCIIKKQVLDLKKDVYDQFYGHIPARVSYEVLIESINNLHMDIIA